MLDFSKWVTMWDAYNSGGAVPGSAASICWNIGLGLILFGLLLLIILPVAYDPAAKGISIFFTVVLTMGVVLAFTSLALPSHTSQSSRPPSLSAQIMTTWNLDDLGECRSGGQKMPESRLKDGDWKCVAYTDSQRTELTVHIKGNKVGLYKADGKALLAKGKD
ncbi:hypothetical protein [Bifidobacterium catenulatum]|uniref:Uncharacterized protein n=1 Tax=Bifidobacterium catenulatum subsp. kashiwanohense TaxID=630129 RepID=A0AA43P631_9BIFI|nr:hypothetical protein [Bifidobacterium catenulatum]MDH7889059.1 hypothetical protein [Bifidobacterium catenulatum subsp. kashiwanohense]